MSTGRLHILLVEGNPHDADLLQEALDRSEEYKFYSSQIEHVADALHQRDPNYADGLPPEALALFDKEGERKNYLILQEILTDMRLTERAMIGDEGRDQRA